MRLLIVLACAGAAACAAEKPAADRPADRPADRSAERPVEVAAGNGTAGAQAPPAQPARRAAAPAVPAHPCLLADGKPVTVRLKAIGTEPFWAAEVEGRCVTYKTPDDQAGTRVWTKFAATGESKRWSGFFGELKFVLVTRPEPGCSDGMSDKRYPMAAAVTIGAEERRGCAEPL